MGLFDGFFNAIGNFFGGNKSSAPQKTTSNNGVTSSSSVGVNDNSAAQAEAERLRKEEEEKKRKQEEARRAAEAKAQADRTAQFQARLTNPTIPGQNTQSQFADPFTLKKVTPVDNRTDQEKELDVLTQKNLPLVKAEMQKQDEATRNQRKGLDKFFYKGYGDKDFELAARNRATTEYQDTHGWNNEPVVSNFNSTTLKKATQNSKDAQSAIQNTKTAVNIARFLPGAGLGEWGANMIRQNTGFESMDLDDLISEQLDIPKAQVMAMSPEDKDKYSKIAQGQLLLGAGADVLPFGKFAGQVAKYGIKNLTKSSVKQVIKNVISKSGLIKAVGQMGTGGAVSSGVSFGVSKATGADTPTAIRAAGEAFLPGVAASIIGLPFDAATDSTVQSVRNATKNSTTGLRKAVETVTDSVADEADVLPGVKTPSTVQPPVSSVQQVAPGVYSNNPDFVTKHGNMFGQLDETEMPTDNTPAYIRKQEADAKAAEQAAKDAAEFDADPQNVPAVQHKKDMQAVIDEETAKLNDLANKPGVTDQELSNAKIAAEENALRRIEELKVKRYGSMGDSVESRIPDASPTARALAKADETVTNNDSAIMANFKDATDGSKLKKVVQSADTAPAATATPQATPATAEGNPVLLSDAARARELNNEGVSMQRGDSVATTAEDARIKAAEQAANQQVVSEDVSRAYNELVNKVGGDEAYKNDLLARGTGRESVNLADVETSAKANINSLDNEQVVSKFNKNYAIKNPQDYHEGLTAIFRLDSMRKSALDAGDDVSAARIQDSIGNAIVAMDDYSSASGLGMRTTQVLYENLPAPLKAKFLENKFKNKLGVDLTDDQRSTLVDLVDQSETFADVSRKNLDEIQAIQEAVSNGSIKGKDAVKAATERLDTLTDAVDTAESLQGQFLGKAVKFLEGHAEGGNAGKRVGEIGRTLMLSAPSGRVFDVISTTATSLSDIASTNASAIIGKAVNLVAGRGRVADTLLKGSTIAKGGANEVGKLLRDYATGNQTIDDINAYMKNINRGDLSNSKDIVTRTVRTAVELPTASTRGLADAKVEQIGIQTGKRLGLSGQELKLYSKAYRYLPTKEAVDIAQTQWHKANMLHQNFVTKKLNAISKGLEGSDNGALAALGGILKNAVMPFSSYLGGSIHRVFTDKNVIHNAFSAINRLAKGDLQGMADNLGKLAVNTGEIAAVATFLANTGFITEDNETQDQSDDYEGLYFHIGDRYIPVGIVGVVAPNIIVGYAFNKAMNQVENEGVDFVDAFLSNAIDAGLKTVSNLGVNSVLGGDNPLQTAFSDLSGAALAKDEETRTNKATDAAAKFAGNVVGQYVNPGIFRDINTGLDANTSLNPTNEQPLTTVKKINPATGREVTDVPATALNKIKSGIPFLSQTLPRKEGTVARDFIDRATKGSRQSDTQAEERSTAEAEALAAADRKERKVPETAEAVQARFEEGDYDLSIEGYKYLMSQKEEDGELSKSAKATYETKIRQAETLRDFNVSSDDYLLYEKTDLSEWRAMGDDESDSYNPELYQKLANLDTLLKTNKATDNSDDPTKSKYTAKKASSSGSKGKAPSTSIGTVGYSGSKPGRLTARGATFAVAASQLPKIAPVVNNDSSKLKKISVKKGVM